MRRRGMSRIRLSHGVPHGFGFRPGLRVSGASLAVSFQARRSGTMAAVASGDLRQCSPHAAISKRRLSSASPRR